MRISTSMMYSGINRILEQQAELNDLQLRLSSDKSVITPADDPLAAAESVKLGQAQAMNTAYAGNRQVVQQALATEQGVLSEVVDLVRSVLGHVVAADNPIYTNADRKILADTLTNARDAILSKANAQDSNGRYLFSGYLSNTVPYTYTDTGAGRVYTYGGNAGERLVQVEQDRQIASSDSGPDIFARATPGASDYIAEAAVGNTGTGVYRNLSVTPGGANLGQNILLEFTSTVGGSLQYTFTVGSGAPSLPVTYVEGALIDMGGVSLSMTGLPKNGDKFTFAPAKNADILLFPTLDRLINALATPVAGNDVGQAALYNVLATAHKKLDLNYGNVLTVQASVGARLIEIDELNSAGVKRDEMYAHRLTDSSELLASNINQMEWRKVVLEASVNAYQLTKSLSLFDRR